MLFYRGSGPVEHVVHGLRKSGNHPHDDKCVFFALFARVSKKYNSQFQVHTTKARSVSRTPPKIVRFMGQALDKNGLAMRVRQLLKRRSAESVSKVMRLTVERVNALASAPAKKGRPRRSSDMRAVKQAVGRLRSKPRARCVGTTIKTI